MPSVLVRFVTRLSPHKPVRRLTASALAVAAALAVCRGTLSAEEGVLELGAGEAEAAARVRIQVDAGGAAPGIDPNSLQGQDSNEGVYVRDSALAVEKLAHAQRMERLKEWDKSADLYQEILEKYIDRVVPSKIDDNKRIYQYTSVVRGVQDQLAKWPEEGRNVYRARYEAKAAEMLESAGRGDLFTLNQIISKYFITESAKAAGLRLLDVNLETGEFLAAARIGDLLLDRHPGAVVERPGVLFRTALAYQLAGDADRAKARLERLRRDHPKDLGTVRGKEVVLADALDEMLKSAAGGPGALASAPGDSWPMFMGGPSRGMVSAARGKPGARLYSIPLAKPDWQTPQAANRAQMETQYNAAIDSGAALGIMPAVDRGELFFQDGRNVYGVLLESKMPLPGWAQTYSQTNGRYSVKAWGSARSQQHTITLTDSAVLAVLGQVDKMGMQAGIPQQGEAQLVCLDRTTGRPNWTVTPGGLQVPKESEAVKSLQFTGSPLVVGDNVLIAARTNKMGQQFEDCWVVCFGLGDGRYRWSCYIASANVPGMMFGNPQMFGSDNTTHLAYADGRVYCMSNLGALAALDAYSGTIIWLNIYPRDNQPQGGQQQPWANPFINGQQMQQRNTKPWAFNPPVVRDGRLFILPNEGKFFLVYDAGTGAEIKRIRLSHLDDPDVLLGVVGDRLFVTGERQIVCLNWPKYSAADFNDDMLFWREDIAETIRGRGFLTAGPNPEDNRVFVPAEDRLFWYDMRTGKAINTYPPYPSDKYPSDRSWKDEDSEEGPGNVIVTSDHVIIAGGDRVDVYTDLVAAKQKLDREVAAAPGDPEPRLRYAEVMFVSGDVDAALVKLDEAIELMGGIKAMAPGAARDRAFNDALTFAQKLATDNREGAGVRAVKFFDRAAAAASSPQQQVNYRLSRARYADTAKDAAAAVRLYQQILSDAQMRTVPLVDETSRGPTRADAVAERGIEELIKNAGPAVYQPYLQKAQVALQQARDAKDPAKLLAVAQEYPNATVATTAMLAAAESYESSDNPRAAIQVLRQMYFKYPTNPEKPRIIESMARNYLKLPNRVEVAAARLAQGAALPGGQRLSQPLHLPNGKVLKDVTFAEALDEVRKVRSEEAAKSLPDFRLAIPPKDEPRPARRERINAFRTRAPQTIAKDVGALVLPPPGRDLASVRSDRVVVWSKTNGLMIFATAGDAGAAAPAQPIGTSDAFPEAPTGLAWVGEDVLVWSPGQVALIPGRGGPAAWRVEVKGLAPLDVIKAADVPAGAPVGQINNGRVFFRGRRQFIEAGGVVQQLGQPQPAAKPAANAPEQIVEARPVGERVLLWTTTGRLLSADLKDGRTAWQTRLADRPLDRVLSNEDFTAVKASDEVAHRIVVLDSFTGQVRGSKSFPTAGGMVPVNVALSPDGTLVYLLPDRLVLKSLYSPWEESPREVPVQAGQPAFAGASRPDQLLIAEGRILVLADSAGGQQGVAQNDKYVRVHSLETGKPLDLRYRSPEGDKDLDRVLTAGTKHWDVGLRVVGPHLYVVGPQTIISYNLDAPAETWKGTVDPAMPTNFRDAFVGQDFLVLLDQPPTNPAGAPPRPEDAGQPAKTYRLHAYGRYPVSDTNPTESGRLDYVKEIADEAGVTAAWQPADGGFYYLTTDGRLQSLAGGGGAR